MSKFTKGDMVFMEVKIENCNADGSWCTVSFPTDDAYEENSYNGRCLKRTKNLYPFLDAEKIKEDAYNNYAALIKRLYELDHKQREKLFGIVDLDKIISIYSYQEIKNTMDDICICVGDILAISSPIKERSKSKKQFLITKASDQVYYAIAQDGETIVLKNVNIEEKTMKIYGVAHSYEKVIQDITLQQFFSELRGDDIE